MAEPINFRKAKAEAFIESLAGGAPIEGVRTHDDMMALAGACLFVARTHGPLNHRLGRAGVTDYDLNDQPAEHQEAADDAFMRDTNAVVEFYAYLTQLVHDGGYDPRFEPEFVAMIADTDGRRAVRPVKGHKTAGI